jgi:hypothetical protein
VLKFCAVYKLALVLIQLDYFYLVFRVFDERAQAKAEIFLRPIAKINCVQRPIRLMFIYLFPFSLILY